MSHITDKKTRSLSLIYPLFSHWLMYCDDFWVSKTDNSSLVPKIQLKTLTNGLKPRYINEKKGFFCQWYGHKSDSNVNKLIIVLLLNWFVI